MKFNLSWIKTVFRKSNIQGKTLSLDQLIQRLEELNKTVSGISVTPDTALKSPTVQAIVRAISSRISLLPIHVYKKTVSNGRDSKEEQPNHPIMKRLNDPNLYQDRVSFWLDAASWLVRYGNFYAIKTRGQTGPIRRLDSIHPASVTIEQKDDLSLEYQVSLRTNESKTYQRNQIWHARGHSLDGIKGNSPIEDVRESIALEIAVEKFGASFFGNGALPFLVFKYADGFQGFETDKQREEFINNFRAAFGGAKKFGAMIPPRGIDVTDPINLDNEKAQFLQTRQYQRTVIAGAFGFPPDLAGDLTKSSFNNMEQQSLNFNLNVILPIVRIFEASMEMDLLTPIDRNQGIIIRFNLNAGLRGDFKSRQEGLKIQREMGVINPNEWREQEGLNPISEEDGGEEYFKQGPSGQNADKEPSNPPEPELDEEGNPITNGQKKGFVYA